MAHELSRLKLDCPLWRIWASNEGWLYATRPGLSVLAPGAAITVHAQTPQELRHAIAAAEFEHARESLRSLDFPGTAG
jgi:hypothetical protein